MLEIQKTDLQEKGAIVQRDYQTYAIAPHLPGGICDPETLRKIADIAEKYQAKALKLTSAQRIAIVGIQEKDLDDIWVDLGIKADREAIKEAKNNGIEYYRMSPEEIKKIRSAGKSLWEEFISDLESKNLPGEKVVKDYSNILRDLGEHPPY